MPKKVNLVGMTFGRLYVDRKAETKCTGGKTQYVCVCDCVGREVTVRGTNLTTKRTSSCGCQNSVGEENITRILVKNGFTFAREYTFSDLADIGKLRFDFAIMDEANVLQYLVEFDGIQHTIATGEGWNTEENLQATKKRDALKNEYAKNNNIPLIRIPYNERDNITLEMLTLETSSYKM